MWLICNKHPEFIKNYKTVFYSNTVFLFLGKLCIWLIKWVKHYHHHREYKEQCREVILNKYIVLRFSQCSAERFGVLGGN